MKMAPPRSRLGLTNVGPSWRRWREIYTDRQHLFFVVRLGEGGWTILFAG